MDGRGRMGRGIGWRALHALGLCAGYAAGSVALALVWGSALVEEARAALRRARGGA